MWLFFFFKQKTAYEMRISDWSSDVCSSDLLPVIVNEEPWAETLELVAKSEHHSLALFFMDSPQEDPRHFDTSALPLYGTLVKVHHASREAGKLQFVAQGLTRVRIRT